MSLCSFYSLRAAVSVVVVVVLDWTCLYSSHDFSNPSFFRAAQKPRQTFLNTLENLLFVALLLAFFERRHHCLFLRNFGVISSTDSTADSAKKPAYVVVISFD